MSDAKGVEPKVEAKPAEPAPVKPASAKATAGEPAEAKPAPAPAAAKPAPPPPPPAVPAPGTVGTRAPAAKTADQNINITISAKAVALVMTALVMVVLILGATTIFLLVRLTDRQPLGEVTFQGPGGEGPGYPLKGAGPGGAAREADAGPKPIENVEIGATFKENLGGKPAALPGTWPTFRGPKFDNIVTDVPLANRWPKAGPPVKWTISGLGQGYSGAAVHSGRVYLQDYDTELKEESLRCFSLEDGKEIWRRSYVMKIVNSHGFTRTVPAVTEKYAVSMGSMCHVLCVDAETGAMKWGINLMKEYGTHNMEKKWYTAQCPLIEGTTVVLAPCGKDVLMMGVDCETGKVLWKTPNPKGLNMSHSSITPMVLNGKRQYVYCAEWGTMVGVSAEKDDLGTLLWELPVLEKETMSPSPVQLNDTHFFMTAGYKAGSALVQVTVEGGKNTAKVLWKLDEVEGLSCEQQTPIFYEKHLFALLPVAAGARREQLVCMDPFNKGKIIWESGNQKKFGQYESMLLADGKFYILDVSAGLTMVKASTKKYEELGRCKLLQGNEAWAPIALVGNLMLLRDSKVLICIDVGKGIE